MHAAMVPAVVAPLLLQLLLLLLPSSTGSRPATAAAATVAGHFSHAIVADGGYQPLTSSAINHWSVTSSNSSISVPATVPGQIQLDLQRASIIGDTYARFNQEHNAWVYRDSWSWSLNFTLDASLFRNSDEVWIVFDGVDTVGQIYLNEPAPPPPAPAQWDKCFQLFSRTLPDPRAGPNTKQGPSGKCEKACIADPLCDGVTTLTGKPMGQCWINRHVTRVSNGTGFNNGDWYQKIRPAPGGCSPPPPSKAGFTVRDQFLRYSFPVKRQLRTSGINTLTVALESVAGLGPGGIHAEWVTVRKEPSNFGYDWSPITETQGIWLPVYLVGQAKLMLLDTVATVHVATTTSQDLPTGFEVKVVTRLNLTAASTVAYTVGGNWSKTAKTRSLKLPAGVSQVVDTLSASTKDVQLWWPAGYGAQTLYTVSVSAVVASKMAQSPMPTPVNASRRIGFRSVAFDTSKIEGTSTLSHHVYVVNGVRIFAQGANWVPPDSFESRATDDALCELLRRAKASNMNFLRIWGGGVFPQDGFFDCADELGLLLEQDEIFSNGKYSSSVDFLGLVAEEVQYQARRLASHPSLFMWSGSNELSPIYEGEVWAPLWQDTIFPNISSIDSSRPVWPACPAFPWKSGVDSKGLPNGQPFVVSNQHEPTAPGEVHAYWFSMCRAGASFPANCRVKGLNCQDDAFYAQTSFASEYGWIGMPSLESLSPVLGTPSEDYTMLSKAMVDRQNRITPISTTANQVMWNMGSKIAAHMNTSTVDSFRRVIHASQVVQSDCLSAESEHYRRGRDSAHATAGATFWMLDDNWPAESWTSLEYGGRPKLLHYAAMRYNSRVAVSSFCTPSIENCSAITAHVSSQRLGPVTGTLQLQVVRWADGKAGTITASPLSLKPQSGATVVVDDVRFSMMLKDAGCASRAECFVKLSFNSSNAQAPVAYQWLTLWKDANLKAAKLSVVLAVAAAAGNEANGTLSVTVLSDAVAPQVMVHCAQASDFGSFDSNAILLMPGVRSTVMYTPKSQPSISSAHTPCTKATDFYAVAVNGLSG
jgi:beta-mannosidase